MTSTTNASGGQASFSDTILAMDIVDTIRHDARLREFELSDTERRKALKERLRQAYAAQGDTVDDAVLEQAIERMNEDRFVHHPMKPGIGRLAATIYVRRRRYGTILGVIVAGAVAISAGYGTARHYLVDLPRERAEASLVLEIGTVIPGELDTARNYALAYADRMGDRDARARIEAAVGDTNAALTIRDAAAARSHVARIRTIGDELSHRAAAVQLVKDAESVVAPVIEASHDPKARAALSDIAASVRDAAVKGDEAGFREQVRRFRALDEFIRTPYKIQIVNRSGVRTGVERTHHQSGNKYYYIVVEAISPSGIVKALDVKDNESGRTINVATWAIQVPHRVYQQVGRDKQDGRLDDDTAGAKPAGKLDIEWAMPVNGGLALTRW